jgi:ATP-dependent helicase HrpA
VRTHAATRVLVVVEAVEPVLALAATVRRTLESLERGQAAARTAATRADVRAQLDSLVRPGFVAATGVARLRDVRRYLLAMQHRLERAATNPREPVLQQQVDAVEAAYADLLESLPPTRRGAPEVTDIAWMVEELRVSLFAQTLGTSGPVSEKRVRAAIAAASTASR